MQKSKVLVALLASCLAGLTQADTGASFIANLEGTITGEAPVDDESALPERDGYGGYGVSLDWPGTSFHTDRFTRYGWASYVDGYDPMVAGIFITGGWMEGSISFPNSAVGFAVTFGNGSITYTLLPGATLTFGGSWQTNWVMEQEGAFGSYELTLRTWEGDNVDVVSETLLSRRGSFDHGSSGFYDTASFSFTNDTNVPIERTFVLNGYLSLQAVPPAVTPVPEPQTYAMMLAGLTALSFVGRKRLNG